MFDTVVSVAPVVELPDKSDLRLTVGLSDETVVSRRLPDAAPAPATALRLRLDPVGEPAAAAAVQLPDGVSVLQDRVVVAEGGRALVAFLYAERIPSGSGGGRQQQRPAAVVVAEVAESRHRHPGEPVDAVLQRAAVVSQLFAGLCAGEHGRLLMRRLAGRQRAGVRLTERFLLW